MELSISDRLILWNQYEILKSLYPQSAATFEEKQEILANGYEIFYSEIRDHITLDPMSNAKSKIVIEILEMYRALESFYATGGAPVGFAFDHFSGFDGNNETEEFAFANFLFDVQGKWPESAKFPRNSHMQILNVYGRMVSEWKQSASPYKLTSEDVQRICR